MASFTAAGALVTPTMINEQISVQGTAFPLVLAPPEGAAASQRTFDKLISYVTENRRDVLEAAHTHGAVLLRGFDGDSAEGFAAVAEALNLEKYPYVGGAAPRTNVVRDVVFTTNESPPSEPIPFHHEIAQNPNPPSYIMFYCDVEPASGGETPIIRSDAVAEFFFREHPAFAAEVEAKGVRYVRTMPLEDDNSSAIGRSWKSTFQCSTKEEAEAAMTRMGFTWEWLPNGDVKTTTDVVPAIRTDQRTGRKMFFNSVVAAFTGWIDSRNDPTKAVVLGDGSPVNGDALLSVAAFQRDNRVAFRWRKGDIIIIDNFTTMHSRNTFTKPRRILAAIGGPSLDGYAVGSGIRAAESAIEDVEATAAPGAEAKANEAPAAKRARVAAAAKIPAATLLRTGDQFPMLGLGTWKISRDTVADAVVEAIRAGWRHFDCACDYGNEVEVGQGLRRAMDEGLVTREELWITSKLWNTYHAPENVRAACERTLSDLGLEYLDLYLIHFPISLKFVPFETRYPPEWVHNPEGPNPRMEYENVPLHRTWPAMESLVDAGLVRNIGMCNVGCATLRDMLYYARLAPQVLQVELHPYNTQEDLLRFCKESGICVTGFSPLGAGGYIEMDWTTMNDSALVVPQVVSIAEKHGKSPAQVILRWGVQRGTVLVPKTTKAHRMVENISIFDFELTEEEMQTVSKLNINRRFNDPRHFTQGMASYCPIYQ